MESVLCQRLTFSQIILAEVLQNMVECVPFSTENNNCFPLLSQKDDVLNSTKLTVIKNISSITKTCFFNECLMLNGNMGCFHSLNIIHAQSFKR